MFFQKNVIHSTLGFEKEFLAHKLIEPIVCRPSDRPSPKHDGCIQTKKHPCNRGTTKGENAFQDRKDHCSSSEAGRRESSRSLDLATFDRFRRSSSRFS